MGAALGAAAHSCVTRPVWIYLCLRLGFTHVQSAKIVFVEHMLNDTVGRAIPIERVAVKLDGANRTRPYIGAAPAPSLRPEFASNGKIGVFQRHSRHRQRAMQNPLRNFDTGR